jgi:poly-gamma-glutamate synthase PgsB/CapB
LFAERLFVDVPIEVALTAILWLLLVSYFIVEYLLHARLLKRIPVRIHVNGTRGKTSVARLIAAGLRAGNQRVFAKTSGTLASVTDENGHEFPVFRFSQPNIIEQMRVMRRVAKMKPDAVVFECMALQPRFQSLTETHMIRSTHGVITNARRDHLDVMGPTGRHVAIALAGSTPVKGQIFTGERKHFDVLQSAARDRGSQIHQITEEQTADVTEADLADFKYREHAENVALSLAVCAALGVTRDVALGGMAALEPEPGATQVCKLSFHGRELVFVNAFAANDPESTQRIWERIAKRYGPENGFRRIAIVNCRADRPQRSHEIAVAAVNWSRTDHFVVIGSGTIIFLREALKQGIPSERITVEENVALRDIIESILELSGKRAVIVGMANIKGGGGEIARYFGNRAEHLEPL